MNANLNPETLTPVIGAIKSNLETIKAIKADKDMTFAEAAQMFLMDKLGYTQIQAKEIYEEIEKGIADYTARYDEGLVDPNAVAASIAASTANYSTEERHNIYVNVLTTLQLAEAANADADVEALREQNAALDDDKLVEAIVASLGVLPFESLMEGVKDGVTPELIALVGDTREMRTREFKIAAAIVLYANQKVGNVKLTDDDTEIAPHLVGAMAAASADAMAATLEYKEGKIELTVWQAILKAVLSALFSVAFAAICTLAILSLNVLIAKIIFSVCGIGILALALTLPALYYFNKNAIKTSEAEYAKTFEKFAALYDSLIGKVTAIAVAVYEKIKAWVKAAREKVMEKASQVKEAYSRKKNEAEAQAEADAAEPALS